MRRKSFKKSIYCLAVLYIFNLTMLTPLGMISEAKNNKTGDIEYSKVNK